VRLTMSGGRTSPESSACLTSYVVQASSFLPEAVAAGSHRLMSDQLRPPRSLLRSTSTEPTQWHSQGNSLISALSSKLI
jgi:hypothetical protein